MQHEVLTHVQVFMYISSIHFMSDSSHVGLLHRYGLGLIWTVLVMAEGTDTGEMPSFDPSPSSEAKKRPTSSDGSKSL